MTEYSGVSTTASDSKAKAGRSDDWQATRPSIRERNAFMFNNSLMSDVTFVIKDSERKTPRGPGPYTQVRVGHQQSCLLCHVLW